MTQSPGRPRGTSTRPARQHSASSRVARVWVMAQEKVAPYHAVMTDKTMAKLRTLLKGYAERVAKLQPQPKATDAEGERRREECGERLQQVVLPVLQAFVAELRGVGHGCSRSVRFRTRKSLIPKMGRYPGARVRHLHHTPRAGGRMRESSPHGLTERRRAILRQASAALRGRLVTLWRVRRWGPAVAEVASAPAPPPDAIEFDVAGVLRRWGRVLCDDSLWLGCRLGAHRWHVAPVRDDLPTPPPAAIERRSPERLTLELVGLSLGALERLWTAADQATVYLCAALDVLDGCLWHVREATGLSIVTRAHLLADLAAVATAIDDVLSPSA